MARVTVEDCKDKVKHRFELIVLSAFRAKQLYSGVQPLLESDGERNEVLAIREIEEGKIQSEDLKDSLVATYQEHILDTQDAGVDNEADAELLKEIKAELDA